MFLILRTDTGPALKKTGQCLKGEEVSPSLPPCHAISFSLNLVFRVGA